MNKKCVKCDMVKDITEFYRIGKYRKRSCKSCVLLMNEIARNKRKHTDIYKHSVKKSRDKLLSRGYFKNYFLQKKYGMTLDEYNKVLIDQNNVCKICGLSREHNTNQQLLTVDHCHRSGKIRGIICNRCNLILGRIQDDISILLNMVNYLS